MDSFEEATEAVESVLESFLSSKYDHAMEQGLPGEVTQIIAELIGSGGKRLRPLYCTAGWQAAGGRGLPMPVIRTAAALEMFHTFALIHDDVMDDSAMRRGLPTAHHLLAARLQARNGGAPEPALGKTTAILLGDLALSWSDELLHTAGLDSDLLHRVLSAIDTMRTELMYGQYLDLIATGRPTADMAQAMTIARLKTAKYTVERPLHIGAIMAGAHDKQLAILSEYAVPLGEAFQLRDDLLGVFGHPQETGKDRGDDLRAAKHTTLVALALERAGPAQHTILHDTFGRLDLTEADVRQIQGLLTTLGVRDTVEQLIVERYRRALRALDGLPPPGAELLSALARMTLR